MRLNKMEGQLWQFANVVHIHESDILLTYSSVCIGKFPFFDLIQSQRFDFLKPDSLEVVRQLFVDRLDPIFW